MQSINPSVHAKTICTVTAIVGCCLLFAQARAQQAGQPGAAATGGAQFEPVSVAVAAGSNCVLHPEGNQDPKESLHVNADEDGVARFLAVRPTANSVEKLVLDCTDANKHAKTYSVDLRSEETFKPRPFDASQTTLRVRSALTDDPSRFTQEELLKAGYGLRPDAKANPDLYQKWLMTASMPLRVLRTDRTLTASLLSRHLDLKRPEQKKDRRHVQNVKSTATNGDGGWTGPVLSGSFKKGATAAETTSYRDIMTSLYVPTLLPGPSAAATIWVGLDNVFQTIIDVTETSTAATFGIHRQDFSPHGHQSDEAGTRFTPSAGDLMWLSVWYCDSQGHGNLDGGYACSFMIDVNQHTMWECDQADSSDCPSYKLDRGDLGNGKLGQQAEFIIENDSASQQWPIFSPVVMNGSAGVVKGNELVGRSVGTTTDPFVQLFTDGFSSTRHVHISLSPDSTKWDETICSASDKWDGNKGECVPKH